MSNIQVKHEMPPVKVYTTTGYEFNLFSDRLAILLGGKDYFSVRRDYVAELLKDGVDTRIASLGYTSFKFNFDGAALSIGAYTFDKDAGALIRGWAQATL